jgi:hypothetical protein
VQFMQIFLSSKAQLMDQHGSDSLGINSKVHVVYQVNYEAG